MAINYNQSFRSKLHMNLLSNNPRLFKTFILAIRFQKLLNNQENYKLQSVFMNHLTLIINPSLPYLLIKSL